MSVVLGVRSTGRTHDVFRELLAGYAVTQPLDEEGNHFRRDGIHLARFSSVSLKEKFSKKKMILRASKATTANARPPNECEVARKIWLPK